MYWLSRNKTKIFFLFIIFLAILPIIAPLFQKGFFVTDDGEWMIIRLSAFYQALADGQLPVRFLGRLNHEYGYPVATFLYPGFLYVGSIIHALGTGFVNTTKIILGLSILGSSIFTFFWLRSFFEKIPSIFGTLSYVYAPYYLFDIYTRGSVGEVLALTIIPFIFWQIERKSSFWTSIGIGFLILSHNILAVLFLFMTILYMGVNLFVQQKMRIPLVYMYTLSIVLGLGLSAFFWLPVLYELQLTKFSESAISNPFEYFASFQLTGYSSVLILLTAISLFIFNIVSIKKQNLTALFLAVGALSIFLASDTSVFLWNIFPASFIQFPFRFLSVAIVASAFLAAFVFTNLKGVWRIAYFVFLASLFAYPAYLQISQIEYTDKGEGFYTTNSATTTVHDEYIPIWVKNKPDQRFDEKVEIIGSGVVKNLVYNNKSANFSVNLDSDSSVQVNTIYWPGWRVHVSGDPTKVSYDNPRGVMQFDMIQGSHNIILVFKETDYRMFANILSIVSFVLLIIGSRKRLLWKK